MAIISDYNLVIKRQEDSGLYDASQFDFNTMNTNYWSAHLIEELCEFSDSPIDKAASEAADCIIFLQTLTHYLYPQKTLTINFLHKQKRSKPLPKLILNMRENLSNRKSWKECYFCSFEMWIKDVVEPIINYLTKRVNYSAIESEYHWKIEYNFARTDWNRKCITQKTYLLD